MPMSTIAHHDARERERSREAWVKATANLPENAFGDNANTQDEDVGTYYSKGTFVAAGHGYGIYDEGHDKT
jgi:hypothetical protein